MLGTRRFRFEELGSRSILVVYWDFDNRMEEEGAGYAVQFEELGARSLLVL